MKVISVYSRYYSADCEYNDIPRKGAEVKLISTYDDGNIKYEVSVNFFPFRDPQDFVVTFDAIASKEIYNAPGRRSKKREANFLKELTVHADEVAATMGGTVFWDQPVSDARLG